MGVGAYNQGTEFYFLFSDGSKCGTVTTTNMSNFSEVKIDVDPSNVRRVKLQYFEHSTAMGLFSGMAFYDVNGK